MRLILVCLLFAFSPLRANLLQTISVSPDKTWEVQLRQADGLNRGDADRIEIVNRKTGKIGFSFVSIRRGTDAIWSPDGKSLAINDHIATKGDFLYIFRLLPDHIVTAREPGERLLPALVLRANRQSGSIDLITLIGTKWTSASQLSVWLDTYRDASDSDFSALVRIDTDGRLSVSP